jgi:hypothetical protein
VVLYHNKRCNAERPGHRSSMERNVDSYSMTVILLTISLKNLKSGWHEDVEIFVAERIQTGVSQ